MNYLPAGGAVGAVYRGNRVTVIKVTRSNATLSGITGKTQLKYIEAFQKMLGSCKNTHCISILKHTVQFIQPSIILLKNIFCGGQF